MSSHYKPSYSIEVLKQASNKRFGIVSSEWNSEIIERLLNGAYEFFSKIDINKDSIQHYSVPGSFELIHACSSLINNFQYSAIIVVGCIIKGQTYHFECISNSVANSIGHLNSLGRTPVVFCVLTDNNIQQSLNRSGGKYGNKGEEAAITALRMATLKFK